VTVDAERKHSYFLNGKTQVKSSCSDSLKARQYNHYDMIWFHFKYFLKVSSMKSYYSKSINLIL
jgi:hypothetical protein